MEAEANGADAVMATGAVVDPSEAARQSQKDCRVYVGNLSYEVKGDSLKDFMRAAGNVVFSEILSLPNGMSKGCGIVEYSSPEEAHKAITQLSDTPLLGRTVFIREDREAEARYGAPPNPGRGGMARGGFGGPRGGFAGRGGYGFGGPGFAAPPAMGAPGTQLYIGNLPFQAGWQELKDLFRSAGNIVRADINMGPDGRPKGSGIVVFASPEDAQNAVQMYNGFDWNGRQIEVREDRYANSGYGGGGYGGPPGGYGGYGGGYGGRGGFGGGYMGRGGFRGGFAGGRGGHPGAYGAAPFAPVNLPPAEPSQQIFVKNLPWSTSNEDLVELFQTTGKVDEAEILFEHGRSKGVGVVQFATVGEAETAIAKFSGYVYGGRALDLEFNRSWRDFARMRGAGSASAGEVAMS